MDKMHKRGAASLRTGTEGYWFRTYITPRAFYSIQGKTYATLSLWSIDLWYSDYSLSLFTSPSKIKVPKWKQTHSATYHVIKMVVYVKTIVQIIILFQNYILKHTILKAQDSVLKTTIYF